MTWIFQVVNNQPHTIFKVKINGDEIIINAQKKPTSTEHITIYPKLSCNGMEANNINDLFEHAVSKSQKKYDLLYLNTYDPDKLKDTYNLEMAMKPAHSNHVKYDLHNMFMVVKPHQYLNESKTVNIYMYYISLTAAETAHKNAWYTTMTEDIHIKYSL